MNWFCNLFSKKLFLLKPVWKVFFHIHNVLKIKAFQLSKLFSKAFQLSKLFSKSFYFFNFKAFSLSKPFFFFNFRFNKNSSFKAFFLESRLSTFKAFKFELWSLDTFYVQPPSLVLFPHNIWKQFRSFKEEKFTLFQKLRM